MSTADKTRDSAIDNLRCIGLLCIILAHVSPPNWLFQIRNFDVPLMVFLSGYLYRGKQERLANVAAQLNYIGKRFVRLVLPVWFFLTFFYLLQSYFPAFFTVNYSAYPNVMLSSYLLMDGFGYVWIIRIFLLMAILGPLAMKYFQNPRNLFFYYALYELCYYFFSGQLLATAKGKLFNEIVGYTAGFLIFFIIGSLYDRFNKRQLKILLLLTSFISLAAAIYSIGYQKESFNIGDYKYPPRLFYLYYALAVCLLLFQAKAFFGKINNSLLSFIGSSSIWIYLWHILLLFLIPKIHWGSRFILVLSLALLLTYLQQRLVAFFIRVSGCSTAWSKQLRIIFCS